MLCQNSLPLAGVLFKSEGLNKQQLNRVARLSRAYKPLGRALDLTWRWPARRCCLQPKRGLAELSQLIAAVFVLRLRSSGEEKRVRQGGRRAGREQGQR